MARQTNSNVPMQREAVQESGLAAAAALRVATFAGHVGEPFALETDEQRGSELTLVEANTLPAAPGGPRGEPFVLLFRAPRGCELGQGIVRLERPETGPFELFLVPVASDNDGVYFEAIFN